MRKVILIIVCIFPCLVHSQGNNYINCAVAGYFEGEQSQFYKDLAFAVVSKNNLSKEVLCKESYQKGVETAKFYRAYGDPKNIEARNIAQQAALFKAKIRRFILEGAGM